MHVIFAIFNPPKRVLHISSYTVFSIQVKYFVFAENEIVFYVFHILKIIFQKKLKYFNNEFNNEKCRPTVYAVIKVQNRLQ